MNRAVFLDRDGVLMRDLDYVSSPSQVKAYRGAATALRLLRKAGYKLIVVTNQSGIARGYFTEKDFRKVNGELLRQLRGARWDGLFHSPHGPKTKSPDRKPGTGMLRKAARRFKLDLTASWMVGDKTSDIKAGTDAGCKTILVRTGKAGKDGSCKAKADFVRRDVLAAARLICRNPGRHG